MNTNKKLSGYYGMKADLSNDLERVFKKSLGKELSYDILVREVLKKYGFGEKILLDMLEPYEKEGQFFFDVVENKKVLSVAPDWKMGEGKDLFDEVFIN